ncbi:somatostatin receptor type 5-like [Lytechinus variegatus]|uniref:somatostatin receptor type 5-like n=1 Tax=Lytechinus variegatus TaxID=7654 RepID=UPI001BB17DF5|nr:somatostatin receptor type 5-like [Lytechinus variegatus]
MATDNAPDNALVIGDITTTISTSPSLLHPAEGQNFNSTTPDVDLPFIELFDIYFFLPIAVIGIPCNVIVIWFIAFVPSLRTVINQLKANLALADVIYLTVNPLVNALVVNELSWWQCQIISYMQYIAQQATCCLLLVMTIIRYDATIHPLTSEARCTGARRIVAIVVAWTVSIVLMIPSVFFTECDESVSVGHIITYSYVTMVIFVIPMFVHAYCHVRILRDFSRSDRERKKSEGSIRRANRQGPGQRHRDKRSLTRQVVVIVLVFFVCRAPLEVFLLWKVNMMYRLGEAFVLGRTASIVHLACKTLAYFTGVINPFLYAFCSPSFKSVFREMLPKTWRRDSADSSTHILPRRESRNRRNSYTNEEDSRRQSQYENER